MKYRICLSLFSILLFTNVIILSSQNNAFKDGTFCWGEQKFSPGRADQKFCEKLVKLMANEDILYKRDRSDDLEEILLSSMPQLQEALEKKHASFSEVFLWSMKMSYQTEVTRLRGPSLSRPFLYHQQELGNLRNNMLTQSLQTSRRSNLSSNHEQSLIPRDLFSNNEQSSRSLDEILEAIDIPNRTNPFRRYKTLTQLRNLPLNSSDQSKKISAHGCGKTNLACAMTCNQEL